jgi:hypothetical protein
MPAGGEDADDHHARGSDGSERDEREDPTP